MYQYPFSMEKSLASELSAFSHQIRGIVVSGNCVEFKYANQLFFAKLTPNGKVKKNSVRKDFT